MLGFFRNRISSKDIFWRMSCKKVIFQKVRLSLKSVVDVFSDTNTSIRLTVNSIWGVVPPPLTEKKIVKKNGKCNQDDFLLVLLKSSWTTFKIIFETLSALGLSRDHY